MTRVAIFASAAGSNALNLLRTAHEIRGVQIPILITDQKDCPLREKVPAEFPKTTVHLIPVDESLGRTERRNEHEKNIFSILKEHEIEWCLLAGYFRILGGTLLNAFPSRIINIHPSLLPAYPGLDAYARAFKDCVPHSGVTIHEVDAGIDTGRVLLQDSFPRYPDDTLETFVTRGKAIEWKLYSQFLKSLSKENL